MTTPAGSLHVRPMTAADIPFANEVRSLARWNQTPRDWQGYLAFEPAGCFVAEHDGRPAGTAIAINYGGRVAWIGMVLVHPDFRRLGIGTALLRAALHYLQERRITAIKLDATPMGRPVYVPLGFQDEYEVTRFEGLAPASATVAPDVVPFSSVPFDQIAALDARAFGTPRPAVLADLARRQPDLCFAVRDAHEPCGFLIAREGSSALQLGPCIATNPATADRLLQAFFQRASGRRIYIDVPNVNPAGLALLQRHGFTVQRSFMRMFLGTNPHPGEPTLVFGTSGAEKG